MDSNESKNTIPGVDSQLQRFSDALNSRFSKRTRGFCEPRYIWKKNSNGTILSALQSQIFREQRQASPVLLLNGGGRLAIDCLGPVRKLWPCYMYKLVGNDR
ncbi:unnamed protein product [Pieris brassicae]|uniref:Uncharacterized protein n=1 Tax=Pieris brassicae TaxID=7116 RepID=A0A9P0WWI0_PIEBR|nr:unnamed protein product [Pieris brassicae]